MALFAACVALKLNGSSVGVWQEVLREPGRPPGLLLFTPRHIRADEWYVVTPSMLSQARHSPPFPIANDSLGGGLSPLLMSVPVAYYTTAFRPQLWGFFLFNFEHAFAFYWCCKLFGLLIAFAWLLRQVGIQRREIVVFGTIWLFFSSFTQWWFSSPAMLPEMLACWAICTGCAIRCFAAAQRREMLLLLAAFVFFGINFVLCLYPGFQIPLVYVSLATLIGLWCERRSEWDVVRGIAVLAAAVAAIPLILLPFWITSRETLRMVSETSYPGVFRSSGGALSLAQLFSGALNFFESEQRVPLGFENICEASNFYPLWLLAIVAVLAGVMRNRAIIVALLTMTLIFSIYCVAPLPAVIGHATLFSLTTEGRLFIGIGVAGIILSCLALDRETTASSRRPTVIAACGALLCLLAGSFLAMRNAGGTWNWIIVIVNAAIVGLFFWRGARKPFLIGFAALVAINGVQINPLMSGLAPLLASNAFRAIDKLHASDPAARWIAYEDVYFAQLMKATGASVLNGTKLLPQTDLMQRLDPSHSFASIYNRYAYINVVLPQRSTEETFSLVDFNYYDLRISPDAEPLRERHYNFVVFPRPWRNAALHNFELSDQIAPTQLFIYKRKWSLGDSNP